MKLASILTPNLVFLWCAGSRLILEQIIQVHDGSTPLARAVRFAADGVNCHGDAGVCGGIFRRRVRSLLLVFEGGARFFDHDVMRAAFVNGHR